MYCIGRYNIINDIELLISERINKKVNEEISLAIYNSILEIVIDSLNNKSTKSLSDRVDIEFRNRDIDYETQMIFYDITLRIAEEARGNFIKLGAPFEAMYELKIDPNKHINSFDSIVINYELTADVIYNKNNHNNDLDMMSELFPSLEILNDAYEKVEKECNKKNKNRFEIIP